MSPPKRTELVPRNQSRSKNLPPRRPLPEDISVDPELADKIADCFMYLEMYPQLLELDPLLSTACTENVDFARSVISGLLDELGL